MYADALLGTGSNSGGEESDEDWGDMMSDASPVDGTICYFNIKVQNRNLFGIRRSNVGFRRI